MRENCKGIYPPSLTVFFSGMYSPLEKVCVGICLTFPENRCRNKPTRDISNRKDVRIYYLLHFRNYYHFHYLRCKGLYPLRITHFHRGKQYYVKKMRFRIISTFSINLLLQELAHFTWICFFRP